MPGVIDDLLDRYESEDHEGMLDGLGDVAVDQLDDDDAQTGSPIE